MTRGTGLDEWLETNLPPSAQAGAATMVLTGDVSTTEAGPPGVFFHELDVVCPLCQAPPKSPCRLLSRHPLPNGAHPCRVALASDRVKYAASPLVQRRHSSAPNLDDQVRQFHELCDIPCLPKPEVPEEARVRLRLRLIAEEFYELLAAVFGDKCSQAGVEMHEFIDRGKLRVDLASVADALADLDYVIAGTRLEFGIDGEPIANLVHAANMTKGSGPTREDGKKLKPPRFQAPDIAGELRRQGWKP